MGIGLTQSTGRLHTGSAGRLRLAGVDVQFPGAQGVSGLLEDLVRDGGCRSVASCGVPDLLRARRDPRFRHLLRQTDLLLGEGWGVRTLARLAGVHPPADANRPDLLATVVHACAQQGWRLFMLGGRGEEVYGRAQELAVRFPGLSLAGAYAIRGHLDDAGRAGRLVRRINGTAPDILLCGPVDECSERFPHLFRNRLKAALAVTVWGGFTRGLRETLDLPAVSLAGCMGLLLEAGRARRPGLRPRGT